MDENWAHQFFQQLIFGVNITWMHSYNQILRKDFFKTDATFYIKFSVVIC